MSVLEEKNVRVFSCAFQEYGDILFDIWVPQDTVDTWSFLRVRVEHCPDESHQLGTVLLRHRWHLQRRKHTW